MKPGARIEQDDDPAECTPTGNSQHYSIRSGTETEDQQHVDLQVAALKQQAVKFEHASLDQSVDSIRLVKVLPKKSAQGLIQCQLRHTTIENVTYTCLSYEWGCEETGGWISIDGKPYYVRQNLLDFLEIAQKKYPLTDLWIDALCINQENSEERSHQVHLMGTIYSRAVKVWAWLGNDSITAGIFTDFNTQRILSRYENTPKLTLNSPYLLRHLSNLVEKSYWTRAWITQEIALARHVWLLAKDTQLEVRELPDSLEISIPIIAETRRLQTEKDTLLCLLYKYGSRRCKIKRDTIFSLLALCYEGSNITVDYTVSDTEIMLQVLEACHNYMCLCSVGIVAAALDLRQVAEGAIMIHNVKTTSFKEIVNFSTPQIYSEFLQECRCCREYLDLDPLQIDGQYFCISSICWCSTLHFCLEEPIPLEPTSRVHIVFDDEIVATYTAHLDAAPSYNQETSDSTYSIRLPLQLLMHFGNGIYPTKSRRLPIHVTEEKFTMELYNPLSTIVTGQCLWVEDTPTWEKKDWRDKDNK